MLDSSTSPDLLFQGGGEMGAMMRAFDWASTPLGPSHTWPPELRTTVRIILAAQQPMFIGWSPDLIALYNDAYRPMLGTDKHPGALGAPFSEVFAGDAYPQLKPILDALLNHGEAVAFEGSPVPLLRSGYLEETFFDFGYTPVSGEDGKVGGMFVACTESTDEVLGHRRTLTLAELAPALIGAREEAQIAQIAMATLTRNPHDAPFALLYLHGKAGELTLAAQIGLSDDQIDGPWPLQEVFQAQIPQWIQHPKPIQAGPWPEPVVEVAALPLVHADGHSPALGVLVVGINARKRLDKPYRHFLNLLAQQLSSALERAEQGRQLDEQNAELDARTRALEGFANLTRDLAMHDDPYVLVQRAQEVVLSLLPDGYALYFEPEGERWILHAQTGSLQSEALQAAADAGLPYEEAGNLLTPFTTCAPYYQDQYAQDTDNLGNQVAHLGASATLPVSVEGRVKGVFAVVLFGALRPWTSTERAVMETVVRSLGLALERAEGVGQLARRTQELARSNAELEQFAYIASHDLQAPIRAVTSFAGLIDRKYAPALDDRGRLYLRQIIDGGEHMKRLVDDLLTLSRVHTEQREFVRVDVGTIVDSVVQRLQVEMQGAQLTRTTLPVIRADPQQLDQLFQNLISNGLKYRREGVTPQIQVSVEREDSLWRFAVSDNGIGIEAQYFERIFVIFQRLHGRETYEGTGIGLAVCKKIVERHGGRLWLESTLGQGSTFFFTLSAE